MDGSDPSHFWPFTKSRNCPEDKVSSQSGDRVSSLANSDGFQLCCIDVIYSSCLFILELCHEVGFILVLWEQSERSNILPFLHD